MQLCSSRPHRKHQPNGGRPYISADPYNDPASSGYEALPTVSNGDPTQRWPFPQLQRGENMSRVHSK